jgi:hypothetical protein
LNVKGLKPRRFQKIRVTTDFSLYSPPPHHEVDHAHAQEHDQHHQHHRDHRPQRRHEVREERREPQKPISQVRDADDVLLKPVAGDDDLFVVLLRDEDEPADA